MVRRETPCEEGNPGGGSCIASNHLLDLRKQGGKLADAEEGILSQKPMQRQDRGMK